jgi:alpha-tubulin suppressor-like RCC1 family protein
MSTPFRFKNADNTTVDFEDYYVRADYFRSGNLWLWGSNNAGQLGDNTRVHKSSPVQTIAFGTSWKQVSCGTGVGNGIQSHVAAIKTDGTLWMWGLNYTGQLGDNTITNKSSPVQTVAFGTNWKQVICGRQQTAAIKTDGTLWVWGQGSSGELGDNTITNKSSPVQTVAFGTNWKQVSCGTYGSIGAIKTDGTLWTWGVGTSGQLGNNTITNKSSPVQTVAFGTNWKQVSCGNNNIAAIKTDGTLWTWGYNNSGQLGDNTIVNKSSPVQTIAFGTNWKQISNSGVIMGAIKTDGTLWMWGTNSGFNNAGGLGDNTNINRSSPVQTVTFGTNWKEVNSGYCYVAAIKTDGTLWTWGRNYVGQLGDNTTVAKSSPVQTIALGSNWKQASCNNSTNTAAIQYQDDYQ